MPFQDAIDKLQPIDDDGLLTVLIETPKGSRQKYDVDHETGLFSWSLELPEGVTFPYSFGFVPNTLAEDGDPLDILLLLDGAIPQGTVVKARVIGVLAVEQDEGDAGMVRNDRVIAVADLARSFSGVNDMDDLRPEMLWDIEEFFGTYNRMIDREFKVLERQNRDTAIGLLNKAIETAKNA